LFLQEQIQDIFIITLLTPMVARTGFEFARIKALILFPVAWAITNGPRFQVKKWDIEVSEPVQRNKNKFQLETVANL